MQRIEHGFDVLLQTNWSNCNLLGADRGEVIVKEASTSKAFGFRVLKPGVDIHWDRRRPCTPSSDAAPNTDGMLPEVETSDPRRCPLDAAADVRAVLHAPSSGTSATVACAVHSCRARYGLQAAAVSTLDFAYLEDLAETSLLERNSNFGLHTTRNAHHRRHHHRNAP
jgi:hypothetical protein